MKKLLFTILFSTIITFNTYSRNWYKVIHAIAKVESNHNPKAVNGQYVGYLQIAPILVKECNRILKRKGYPTTFTLKDRYSREKSIRMFYIIQEFYNPKGNIERAIRLWNGGPSYSVRATQAYYNKVMKYLH